MSKEKMKTIILTIILIIIAAALIVALIVTRPKEEIKVDETESNEIMNKFNEYFYSSKRTVIYYASTGCSWCSLQSPILETIASDYNMDYYYLDTAKISDSQRVDAMTKLGIEKHATPKTFIVENGEVIDSVSGYTEGREYVEFFKNSGVIPEDAVYSQDQYLTFIGSEEYNNLISNEGTHIIVIGQTTCSHCIAIKPALNQIAKDYGITINYLDILKLSQEDYTKFNESLKTIEYNDEEFLKDGSFGTPLTLIVKNGKVSSYIDGERTISQLVREFKKTGIISE